MEKFKNGDRVIVYRTIPPSGLEEDVYFGDYPKVGWEGTIKYYIPDFDDYAIKWDLPVNGDLVKPWMIKLIEEKPKEIKVCGLVKFLRQYENKK